MRMLRRIKGVTLRDNVKSVDIRKELGVTSIQEKVRELRLRWYGHMQRMEESNEVRAVVDMMVPGKTTGETNFKLQSLLMYNLSFIISRVLFIMYDKLYLNLF